MAQNGGGAGGNNGGGGGGSGCWEAELIKCGWGSAASSPCERAATRNWILHKHSISMAFVHYSIHIIVSILYYIFLCNIRSYSVLF